MTLGDLHTAAGLERPLVVAVMNDRAFGSERHHLDLEGLPNRHAQFADTDFAAVAAGMGIESATVRSVADLTGHASRLQRRASPLLLDCKINPAVRAPWMANLPPAEH
jgi:thiamine pyrophosphate-dependent acetolactate synthase large subunit-like protein